MDRLINVRICFFIHFVKKQPQMKKIIKYQLINTKKLKYIRKKIDKRYI